MKLLRPRTRTWEKVQNPDRVSKIVAIMACVYSACAAVLGVLLYMVCLWTFSLRWTVEGIMLVLAVSGSIGCCVGVYMTIATIHLALRIPDEDIAV